MILCFSCKAVHTFNFFFFKYAKYSMFDLNLFIEHFSPVDLFYNLYT